MTIWRPDNNLLLRMLLERSHNYKTTSIMVVTCHCYYVSSENHVYAPSVITRILQKEKKIGTNLTFPIP